VLRGGSAIISPRGEYLAGPVFDEPTILRAALDFTRLDEERMTLDVSGHYARPDAFNFSVNPSVRTLNPEP
jgi:nitrilase